MENGLGGKVPRGKQDPPAAVLIRRDRLRVRNLNRNLVLRSHPELEPEQATREGPDETCSRGYLLLLNELLPSTAWEFLSAQPSTALIPHGYAGS